MSDPPAGAAPALERLVDLAALERPARRRRVLLVCNPYATATSPEIRDLVAAALAGRFALDATDTERRGHAAELAREAAAGGYEAVITLGGDGTINEAANGLAGTDVPLGCLPGGSANVFCRILGVPTDVVDATEHMLGLADAWSPRAVDLGRVNGRWFTFASGVGLDASVVDRVDRHPALKARLGHWYYAEATVAIFLSRYLRDPPHLLVEVAGRTLRGISLFVQNGSPYTFFHSRPIDLAEHAALDSGTLAGAVLARANPLDVPTLAWRALSGAARVGRHPHVTAFSGQARLRVIPTDERPAPLQVDGDHVADEAEVRYEVGPGALRVLC